MKKKRLIWQIYPSYLLIILISLIAVSGYALHSLEYFFIEQAASDLETRCRLLEKQIISLISQPDSNLEETEITTYLSPSDAESVDRFCKKIGKSASTRITVILPNGRVIGDSEENPDNMDNHADRPEVIKATTGQTGISVRYSRTLDQRMMYVAVLLKAAKTGSQAGAWEPETGGTWESEAVPDFAQSNVRESEKSQLKAVIRTSVPLTLIDDKLKSIRLQIAMGGCFIALLASGICLYVSRRISRPIEEMKQGAKYFSRGELNHRLLPPNTLEMASLADAMNQMATLLENRITTVINQRNEYETVLSSMMEGVIAVDMEARILSMNQAAINMLNTELPELKGRNIQEIVRNRDLHHIIEKTLSTGIGSEGDIVLHYNGDQILNIRTAPLSCSQSGAWEQEKKHMGILVVLDDVTQLRHLENVRRDFVANVSHEIRTPLTAIKGFVETLRHGAVENPEEAARFLAIIEKHVNRLTAIIEDLLQLSRIEREDEIRQIQLEKSSVKDVIQSAIQICQIKAKDKNIYIELLCEHAVFVKADLPLLEQAVVNLLDNAIKYSKENSTIRIEADQSDTEAIIKIQDYGMGISKKHLPRLFERFYRVDKARSRKMGGTGLGLAIVKHIIQAHNGYVTVESTLGKGSIFSIYLPINSDKLCQKV